MQRQDIAHLRLQNHQIVESGYRTPAKIVDYFACIQAQSLTEASWAIGSRLKSAHHDTVLESIQDDSIIRTWLLKANLNLVTKQDVAWITDLIQPHIKKALEPRLEKAELDASTVLNSQEIIFRELKQHEVISQQQLFKVLTDQGISVEGERGYLLLALAAVEKLVVCAAGRSKESEFTLFDSVVKDGIRLGRKEGLAELARRYFNSRGPALLQDFVWWSGLPFEDIKETIKEISSELSVVKCDGKLYFMTSNVAKREKSVSLQMLPAFDEYLFAYLDRTPVLDPRFSKAFIPQPNSPLPRILVSRAEIVGTWSLNIAEQKVQLQTRPFRPLLPQEEAEVAEAGKKYLEFMAKRDRPTEA